MVGLKMAGWANIVSRIAGGLLLLVLLSFAASPASAHASHDGVAEAGPHGSSASAVVAGRDADVSPSALGGALDSHLACNTCPSCCGMGACPMFPATLANGPAMGTWLPPISAVFCPGSFGDVPGLQSTPGTRPPRLDA